MENDYRCNHSLYSTSVEGTLGLRGLEPYPGNSFNMIKIRIKGDNLRDVQLLHEYCMVGVSKGEVLSR
jgi:hypothetical protein